jgi:glycosyltransferase involved in cell wall biosynthesis
MVHPSVSVVIAAYNYGHFVTEAVDSVLSQTLPPHEVIVVDDGSTDDTPSRVAAYGDRVRYLYQSNKGLSAARNAGIEAATGTYIALHDTDDAFHPRKLELQVAHLESDPSVGLIGTKKFSDPSWKWPRISTPPTAVALSHDSLVIRVRFCPSSALFRRSLWPAIGSFDPAVSAAADRDFWIRAALVSKVALLDAPLTFYRVHSHSMTRKVNMMVAHSSPPR